MEEMKIELEIEFWLNLEMTEQSEQIEIKKQDGKF